MQQFFKEREKAKKIVLKCWMQHTRIAAHCQGTTEKSAVQRKGCQNILKNCNCFFGTFLIYIQIICIILNSRYLLLDSIFENNVIKCFDFPRLYRKLRKNKLFAKKQKLDRNYENLAERGSPGGRSNLIRNM